MAKPYAAFISYRHCPLDMLVAEALHKRIERYRVPRDLRKDGKKTLGTVFRDRDELPLSNNLTQDIYEALDDSRFLIVICTPDTPKSAWVDREIQHFIEKHGHERILTVLAAGTPEESIPKRITNIYGPDGRTVVGEVEPLCAYLADEKEKKVLRKLRSEFLRLAAAILGCPYDALKQRHKRYRTRRLITACSAVLAVLLTVIGLLISWNLDVTQKNMEISRKNEEISQKNEEIQQQYRQTQLNESQALTLLSQIQLEQGDRMGALENAYNGLEGNRPYYAPAEAALADALHVYQQDQYFQTAALQLRAQVKTVLISDDGRYAVAADMDGEGICMELTTGEILWKRSVPDMTAGSRITPDNERIICLSYPEMTICSLASGEVLSQSDANADLFQAISPSCGILVNARMDNWPILDKEPHPITVDVEDVRTGECRCRVSLDAPYGFAAFSRDEQKLLLIPDPIWRFSGTDTLLVDCDTGTVTEVPLPGKCIAGCGLQDGGFLTLTVGETGESAYFRISGQGEILQSYPASADHDSAEVKLLVDQNWLYCMHEDKTHVISLDEELYHDPRTVTFAVAMQQLDVWDGVEAPLAAFTDEDTLTVVSYQKGIQKLYFTQNHWGELSAGREISMGGDVRTAYLNHVNAYGESMPFSKAFLNPNCPEVIALVDQTDVSRVVFVTLAEAGADAQTVPVPGGDSLKGMQEYIAEHFLDPEEPFLRFDTDTQSLYWEGSEFGIAYKPDAETEVTYACRGHSRPWVAVFGHDPQWLHIYDYENKRTVYSGQLPAGKVYHAKFICDDRYLLLAESYKETVSLIETDTWRIVGEYDTRLYQRGWIKKMTASSSADGSRLYLGSAEGIQMGLIIDTQTWTVIAKVPHMCGYDKETDRILCLDPYRQALTAWPTYSVQEMMNMAKGYLPD